MTHKSFLWLCYGTGYYYMEKIMFIYSEMRSGHLGFYGKSEQK